MNDIIPIFPLTLIVYPNSRYPLHIFEERYKKMINRCFAEDKPLGIVPEISGRITDYGSLVSIDQIIKKFPDGKMDIIVKGIDRIQILDIAVHDDGYYIGKVKIISDVDDNFPILNEYEMVIQKFREVLNKAEIIFDDSYWDKLTEIPVKSFKIAEKAGLQLEQQLELLKMRKERERIQFLSQHFDFIGEVLDKNDTMNKIIMSDGFLE